MYSPYTLPCAIFLAVVRSRDSNCDDDSAAAMASSRTILELSVPSGSLQKPRRAWDAASVGFRGLIHHQCGEKILHPTVETDSAQFLHRWLSGELFLTRHTHRMMSDLGLVCEQHARPHFTPSLLAQDWYPQDSPLDGQLPRNFASIAWPCQVFTYFVVFYDVRLGPANPHQIMTRQPGCPKCVYCVRHEFSINGLIVAARTAS